MEALKALIAREKDSLIYLHALTILQRCARAGIDVSTIEDLSYFANLIRKRPSHMPCMPVEVAHSIYALRVLSPKTPGIDTYLEAICEQAQKCNGKMSGQHIGNYLFGLQRFDMQVSGGSGVSGVTQSHVIKLLDILTDFVENRRTPLNGQEISMSLYGLRKMTSESQSVRNLLSALSNAIETSNSKLSQQGISNSLNGLQGMSSNHPETLAILNSLTFKISQAHQSGEILNEKSIGSALMGLKSLSSEKKEVQDLLSVLTVMIRASKDKMSEISICTALHGLGRISDTHSNVVHDLLAALREKLEVSYSSSDKEWDPRNISHALSGLKSMTGKSSEISKILLIFIDIIGKSTSSSKRFSPLDIGNCLYGLQHIASSTCPQIKPLLGLITNKINTFQGVLDSNSLGFAILGLRAQKEGDAEVSEVVSALAKHCQGSKEPFSPQSLSMVMLGLSKMSCTTPECRLLLNAITKRIHKLDAQAIGNVLFSLQKMTSDTPEVRALLSTLAPRIDKVKEEMSPQELANAFYGLQGMDNIHKEVEEVLTALNKKLESLPASIPFTSQGIGNSLSGFQSMDDKSNQVIKALGLLADRIEASPCEMSPQDIANAVFGLQGMTTESDEARAVLLALLPKMRSSTGTFSTRDLGYCLTGLSSMQESLMSCEELGEFMSEFNLKVSQSDLKGQDIITFNVFNAKAVKVKRGA